MSLATNMLMIVVGVNLMLFAFGSPETNSPALAIMKAILSNTGTDWSFILNTLGQNMFVFSLLVLVVGGVTLLTGGTPLSGGGQGATLALQILGTTILFGLLLMPNFSTFFPDNIEYFIQIIFGSFMAVTIISTLRGL